MTNKTTDVVTETYFVDHLWRASWRGQGENPLYLCRHYHLGNKTSSNSVKHQPDRTGCYADTSYSGAYLPLSSRRIPWGWKRDQSSLLCPLPCIPSPPHGQDPWSFSVRCQGHTLFSQTQKVTPNVLDALWRDLYDITRKMTEQIIVNLLWQQLHPSQHDHDTSSCATKQPQSLKTSNPLH